MEEIKIHAKFWSEKLKARYHLEYLDVESGTILKWIIER
jgi:hypothetical protein